MAPRKTIASSGTAAAICWRSRASAMPARRAQGHASGALGVHRLAGSTRAEVRRRLRIQPDSRLIGSFANDDLWAFAFDIRRGTVSIAMRGAPAPRLSHRPDHSSIAGAWSPTSASPRGSLLNRYPKRIDPSRDVAQAIRTARSRARLSCGAPPGDGTSRRVLPSTRRCGGQVIGSKLEARVTMMVGGNSFVGPGHRWAEVLIVGHAEAKEAHPSPAVASGSRTPVREGRASTKSDAKCGLWRHLPEGRG